MSSNLVKLAARNSLIAFTILTHPNYKANWHHRLLAQYLQRVATGEIKRLIISMPPRHGKTELASLRFAPWYMGINPTHNIAQATYSSEFAEENAKKVRNLVDTRLYNEIFDVGLAKDSKAIAKWQTTKGGYYYAVGVGGPLTGRGANLLLIDDPHKNRQEAESSVIRENIWNWFQSTAYTRLEGAGACILIMTRWHEDDLAGRLIRGDEHWDVLSLPAIAEQDDSYRKEGQALWPDKYDLDALANIKTAVGSREWISLYQQRPSAAEGQIFKREWWQYAQSIAVPHDGKIIQSWDTAFKAKQENDFSVCTTWKFCKSRTYLLHRWKERVEYPELKRAAIQLANRFKPSEIDIEDKASGQSLAQELKRETSLPIKTIKVDRDKIARAYAVTPFIEAGNVFLIEDEPWVQDYVDNMASFPNGIHDDDVDSTTQALANHMYRGTTGFLDYYEQLAVEAQKEKECQKSA
jgi:predicted phage terminase large subunit-like protein